MMRSPVLLFVCVWSVLFGGVGAVTCPAFHYCANDEQIPCTAGQYCPPDSAFPQAITDACASEGTCASDLFAYRDFREDREVSWNGMVPLVENYILGVNRIALVGMQWEGSAPQYGQVTVAHAPNWSEEAVYTFPCRNLNPWSVASVPTTASGAGGAIFVAATQGSGINTSECPRGLHLFKFDDRSLGEPTKFFTDDESSANPYFKLATNNAGELVFIRQRYPSAGISQTVVTFFNADLTIKWQRVIQGFRRNPATGDQLWGTVDGRGLVFDNNGVYVSGKVGAAANQSLPEICFGSVIDETMQSRCAQYSLLSAHYIVQFDMDGNVVSSPASLVVPEFGLTHSTGDGMAIVNGMPYLATIYPTAASKVRSADGSFIYAQQDLLADFPELASFSPPTSILFTAVASAGDGKDIWVAGRWALNPRGTFILRFNLTVEGPPSHFFLLRTDQTQTTLVNQLKPFHLGAVMTLGGQVYQARKCRPGSFCTDSSSTTCPDDFWCPAQAASPTPCPTGYNCPAGARMPLEQDSDGDGVPDHVDNCPQYANPDQTLPPVTLGACPTDVTVLTDNLDGTVVDFVLPEAQHNCVIPSVEAEPAAGSIFPLGETVVEVTATADTVTASCSFSIHVRLDIDKDGIPDEEDNCPTIPNPDQAQLPPDVPDGPGEVCHSCEALCVNTAELLMEFATVDEMNAWIDQCTAGCGQCFGGCASAPDSECKQLRGREKANCLKQCRDNCLNSNSLSLALGGIAIVAFAVPMFFIARKRFGRGERAAVEKEMEMEAVSEDAATKAETTEV